MYSEITPLGVYNKDIRFENILAAPDGPTTLPGLHSPFIGNQYQYRIIDLDRCVKLNSLVRFVNKWHMQSIRQIIKMITRTGGYKIGY